MEVQASPAPHEDPPEDDTLPTQAPATESQTQAVTGNGQADNQGELVLPETEWQPLHPLPKGLVQLYGLLAVLFVLVPEWVAGGALFGFRDTREGSMLPPTSGAWKRLPELRLASLSLGEMRLLASQLGLRGYGREGRERLTARLLKRLRRRG